MLYTLPEELYSYTCFRNQAINTAYNGKPQKFHIGKSEHLLDYATVRNYF